MVNQQNAGNILNFEKTFAKLLFSQILRDTGLLQWFSFNFAREIGAWVTRIYTFTHARAFDRGEGG